MPAWRETPVRPVCNSQVLTAASEGIFRAEPYYPSRLQPVDEPYLLVSSTERTAVLKPLEPPGKTTTRPAAGDETAGANAAHKRQDPNSYGNRSRPRHGSCPPLDHRYALSNLAAFQPAYLRLSRKVKSEHVETPTSKRGFCFHCTILGTLCIFFL